MKEAANKPYYVYILRCTDDSLYIGITPNLFSRMKAHCGAVKGGAKYTRSHPVVRIEAAWKTEGHVPAARMEYALKKLRRTEKLSLIAEPGKLCREYVSELCEYCFEACTREFLDEAMTCAKEKQK